MIDHISTAASTNRRIDLVKAKGGKCVNEAYQHQDIGNGSLYIHGQEYGYCDGKGE